MALIATDVLAPAGEIDGPLFYPALASGDVTTRITAYLTQGYAKATAAAISDVALRDQVARLYAYCRAYGDVSARLSITPSSSALEGEGSVTYLQSQIAYWLTRRNEFCEQLESLLPSPDVPVFEQNVSQAIPTRYIW